MTLNNPYELHSFHFHTFLEYGLLLLLPMSLSPLNKEPSSSLEIKIRLEMHGQSLIFKIFYFKIFYFLKKKKTIQYIFMIFF